MRQLTITVPEDRLRRIQKLLRQEPGVTVSKSKPVAVPAVPPKKKLTRKQQEWVDDLKESLREAEAAMRGEIKLPTLQEHLAELRAAREKESAPANAD